MQDDFRTTYTARELAAKLLELADRHGDVPVVTNDPDTNWRMEIGIMFKLASPVDEWPDRIEIRTTYHGRPEGAKP